MPVQFADEISTFTLRYSGHFCTVLQAKRELEVQFQHYLSVSSRDENRLEVGMAADWWASSLESDPSVDSMTQVTSFRGPEFFHSPVEKEGPFTNISRGIT